MSTNNKTFDINDKEVKELIGKFDKIKKSDLPLAVRGALNNAAIEMKKSTMQKEFNDNFTIRRSSFLKAHTGFNKCDNTFDVSKMKSEAGVIKGKSIAGDRLEMQEIGGNISNRSVPTNYTRKSENESKTQKVDFYYNKFKNASFGTILRNKNKAIKKNKKAVVLYLKGGESKLLYSLNRNVKIHKKPFIELAGDISAKKISNDFLKILEKRLKKYSK